MTVMRHTLRLYLRPLVGCDTIACVETWRGTEDKFSKVVHVVTFLQDMY